MVPEWDALVDDVHVVSLPMRVPFRGVRTREALLLRGPSGWGEFAPFLEYDDTEAARWLGAAIEAAFTGWPAARRAAVPVNATVPAVSAREVANVLARFPGCTTAKVKVAQAGQTLSDDLNRVAEVRSVLGRGGRVRVDANGAWSVEQALHALQSLAPYDLEYAEQPCATVAELTAVRAGLADAGVPMLIAADESVRKADDPAQVALAGAADILVVKVAPLGGVTPALSIAAACGLPVVVSSALDTSIGIRAGIALAAALPDLPYACGLGTASLLGADVVRSPLLPVAGAIEVGSVIPDPELLAAATANAGRRRWWLERLRRCHAVLTAAAATDSHP